MMGFKFLLKRLGFAVLLLFTVSFLVFCLQSVSKNSIVSTVLGGRPGTPEQVAQVRAEYHLDDPFLVRFGIWLRDAVQLDFGTSIRTKEPVMSAIADRLPVTLELTVLAIVLVVLIGVPFGMLAGILTRYALRNVSIPVVTVTGLLMIYLIGGTILVEQVFSIQGLEQLMVTSVELSDVPVVQGIAPATG